MILSEELASLCVQASRETDPKKFAELMERINALLDDQKESEEEKLKGES